MSAKIRNLDETLPKVPKPRVTSQPYAQRPLSQRALPAGRGTGRTLRKAQENIITDAVGVIRRRLERGRSSMTGWRSTALMSIVAARLEQTRDGVDVAESVEELQKTFSLLTWEMGEILRDLEALSETNKKENDK